MAKVRGALLSISAQGQIAKTMVFAAWRGVPYARQHVTPSNPNSLAQQEVRNIFAALSAQWLRMATIGRKPWEAASVGRAFTARNKIISSNLSFLIGQLVMDGYQGSPGAGGGLPPTSMAAVGGVAAGEINLTIGAPAVPAGWTLDAVQATAFLQRDPKVKPTDFVVETELVGPAPDTTNPLTISGLDTGQIYVCSAWLEWSRPDGVLAYGTGLTAVATAT